jgi:hypothetical protein
MTTRGVRSMEDVLPDAFGPENLEDESKGFL